MIKPSIKLYFKKKKHALDFSIAKEGHTTLGEKINLKAPWAWLKPISQNCA